jgi:hypothetical protein
MSARLDLVLLGLGCDRGAWPEAATGPLADGAAAAGMPVVGPQGLLQVVETALGLGGPAVAEAVRLAAWRAKLEAAGTARFWSRSLARDPLATAEVTLRWRDGLFEAGWDPRAAQPAPRLADLAAAKTAGPALPAGVADRLAAAVAALARAAAPPVARLDLLDARAGLPPGIARLVDALERAGTEVRERAEPLSPALGDLGAVQGALRQDMSGELHGDGSFALLHAETETAAAEVVADWLAAGGATGHTVIIADRPTTALDAALVLRGLPPLGAGAASAQRGVLQLLPLLLATRWRPFDAARMLELLQARPSPIPFQVARALTRVLVQAPGRGGTAWIEALAKGRAELAARLAEEEAGSPTRPAAPRLARATARIEAFVEAPLADPDAGIPVAELRGLCTLLGAWAGRAGRGEDRLLAALAAACADLAEAARLSGRTALPRIEVERLTEAALGRGLPDPACEEGAAPWAVLRDPAALWDRVETVVWWGMAAPPVPPAAPWDAAERTALAASGCTLPDRAEAAAALAAGWRRPLLHAARRALLVPVPDPAEPEALQHPVLDELHALLAPRPPLPLPPAALRPQAEALLDDPGAMVLGTALPRAVLARASLPVARTEWTIPAGVVAPRPVESATSIEKLLGCAYAWVAQHTARLRGGRVAEVPDGARLAGLLAHRLAQEIFLPGTAPDPAAARTAAAARLPALLEEMAAPLLAAGMAADRTRMTEDLPRAMEALAIVLRRRGLSVVEPEAQRSMADAPEPGGKLSGAIDLLLAKADGSPALLDLKWSSSGRRRRAEVDEGRAVQLAAYAAMADAGEDAGFFMLAQRRVVAGAASVFGGPAAPALGVAWSDLRAARRLRLATAQAGTLRALGIGWDDKKSPKEPDPDGAPLRMPPPCRFCDLGRLCGKETLR